jgi:two-component system sensor histidine kinase KdpD
LTPESRPNPDELLNQIREAEQRSARGKLKIFFGASAGVGKTYAMLSAARQQREHGVEVVIGIIETHGRRETEAMAEGLDQLPRRQVEYRGRTLDEFDLDAAIARRPQIVLVDELAHSNVAGSRHPKRWQDVEELLSEGIDVYSTINVQHLETLNDIIGGITGIRVWETVPDHVFDAADEVVLVDLPPDELLQRLKEGKVYLPHQAERAIQSFFRKGNLIALRELALRRTADRVDNQMVQYRRETQVAPLWRTRESILVCIGPNREASRIIRAGARLASRLDVPWHVLYVETPELQKLSRKERTPIFRNLKLAQDMGAETATLTGRDAAQVAVEYAQQHQLTRIVVGRPRRLPWYPWFRSFGLRVGQLSSQLDIIQVAQDDQNLPLLSTDAELSRSSWFDSLKAPWQSFAQSAALCAATSLVAMTLLPAFDLANIAMLFLLAVLLSSWRYGYGPSVFASFLNVLAFDYFFVPPRFSFAVSDVQYLLTFGVMLAVGLVTARLTTHLSYQAKVAGRRERRMRSLYEMSRDLSGALLPEQIAEISQRFAETEFFSRSAILLINDDNQRLQDPIPVDGGLTEVDTGIAQWAFDHESEAGCGTDTLPGGSVLFVPLKAPMRYRGVLALEPRDPSRLQIPEQKRLLETFARLIAISLERVHYVQIAQTTSVQMESERLRNSLLSAISHDLRTPLAALVNQAELLPLTHPAPSTEQLEIAHSIRRDALRMNSLVNNLLDMARLESGAVRLNRHWQPLEEVVGSALRASHPLLGKRQVTVNIPDEPALLEFDAVLMERVFCNLLENACKYTPENSHISIGLTAISPDQVEIFVEDDGPGLPQGKEKTLFNKFERGQKESATPGVGLGLSICRAIIEAHSGTIHAENKPRGGARICFTLPLKTPPTLESGNASHLQGMES